MTVLDSKTCPVCEVHKPSSEYWTASRRGGELWWMCKACSVARQKKARLRDRYGLGPDEYAAMIDSQGGVCAVCGDMPTSHGFHVDHDHETNEIRGMLCSRCNMGLGFFLDSTSRLAAAIKYLSGPGTGRKVPSSEVALKLRNGYRKKGDTFR